ITTASISLLLQARGLKVRPMKCDMYLNFDAGTMNPLEHGEVFVTDDGKEADQDLGHYERFLGQPLGRANYLTAGQVYSEVMVKERELGYEGRCVDAYLTVPEKIIEHFETLGEGADVVMVEFGGTVGEYQNVLFFEAARRLKIKYPKRVVFVHVGYLPIPGFLGEMKSKPLQQSVQRLNSMGISPDLIVCRAEKEVDERRKEKISLAAALGKQDIVSNPDLPSVYQVPLKLEEQKVAERIGEKLGLKFGRRSLALWGNQLEKMEKAKKKVKIGIVAKYYSSGGFSLGDSYVSVVEAIKHASWELGIKPEINWFDSERFEKEKGNGKLAQMQAVIVPQGWGSRGVEGKIKAIRYARENKLPFLGLCFGMQMALIEFGRNVLGLKGANSMEVDPKTSHPVVHIMPDQKKYLAKKQFGGTIRLGAWPCEVKTGSRLAGLYGQKKISERHRHRYEFNNEYRERYEKAGMVFAGLSPDGQLVEAIELPDHPFFVATQFHPEYKSQFLKPHPVFLGLIKAAAQKR
ncbi:CTP synthase, partial [Patescibacteria group bacterium]|nr:CTP synthase [Patescibacteria group bacterium]